MSILIAQIIPTPLSPDPRLSYHYIQGSENIP